LTAKVSFDDGEVTITVRVGDYDLAVGTQVGA
jgi:hypothetical protein